MYIEKNNPELRRIVEDAADGFNYKPKDNAYGTLMYQNEDGTENPVICGHGGSMWLCPECKKGILEKETADV